MAHKVLLVLEHKAFKVLVELRVLQVLKAQQVLRVS
jgi:hypothetical protein